MPSHLRRILSAAACATILCLRPFAQPGRAHMCSPDPVVPVPGMLLVPRASGLARFSLSERAVEQLPVLPSAGVVSQVARSPDGSRLAVARFSRPDGDPIGGADI